MRNHMITNSGEKTTNLFLDRTPVLPSIISNLFEKAEQCVTQKFERTVPTILDEAQVLPSINKILPYFVGIYNAL
jgi:hypothetical protein